MNDSIMVIFLVMFLIVLSLFSHTFTHQSYVTMQTVMERSASLENYERVIESIKWEIIRTSEGEDVSLNFSSQPYLKSFNDSLGSRVLIIGDIVLNGYENSQITLHPERDKLEGVGKVTSPAQRLDVYWSNSDELSLSVERRSISKIKQLEIRDAEVLVGLGVLTFEYE